MRSCWVRRSTRSSRRRKASSTIRHAMSRRFGRCRRWAYLRAFTSGSTVRTDEVGGASRLTTAFRNTIASSGSARRRRRFHQKRERRRMRQNRSASTTRARSLGRLVARRRRRASWPPAARVHRRGGGPRGSHRRLPTVASACDPHDSPLRRDSRYRPSHPDRYRALDTRLCAAVRSTARHVTRWANATAGNALLDGGHDGESGAPSLDDGVRGAVPCSRNSACVRRALAW